MMATKKKRRVQPRFERTRRSVLEWKARPRVEKKIVAKRTIWETRCGRYRVVRSHIVPGENAAPKKRLADRFYAELLTPGNFISFPVGTMLWANLSVHRALKPAVQACQKHASAVSPEKEVLHGRD